ncbi:hypothetical protein IAT38_003946 [Cryptococcus sp. DSM 104549]
MARASYRDTTRWVDVSDSESEEEQLPQAVKEVPKASISLTAPQRPRRAVTARAPPLTPRRTVAFAPTPSKKPDSSQPEVKPTPGKNSQAKKFAKSPAPRRGSVVDEEGEPDEVFGGDNDEAAGLSLGGLKLDDDVNEDMDDMAGVLDSPSINVPQSPPFFPTSIKTPATTSAPTPPTASLPSSSAALPPKPKATTTATSRSQPIIISDSEDDAPFAAPSPPARLASESEDDSDWMPRRTPKRTPGKARRVVLSDSEEEEQQADPPKARVRRKKAGARGVMKFLDTEAVDDKAGEEDEGEYSDDSMGSLRDFIVDDDDGEYENTKTASETDSDSEIEIIEPPPRQITRKGKKPAVASVVLESEEIAEEEAGPDILHFSPARKPITILDLAALIISSDSEPELPPIPAPTPRSKTKTSAAPTPSRKAKGKPALTKKDWAEERERIAREIFEDLDERVFEGKLGAKGAGARLDWNNRLLTTAGVAQSKKVTRNGVTKKEHWIELSEKVLTGEEQILSTVAHEMCHLATWIISGEFKNPHGRIFKSWGRKVMNARKDVEVTTKHTYTIEYKYEWQCVNEQCGKIYRRHSKSIDPAKHLCGGCKSKLNPLFETKQQSAFQVYLKENMANAKAAMPGQSHGDVMRALSKRWTAAEGVTAAEHWVYWKCEAVSQKKPGIAPVL